MQADYSDELTVFLLTVGADSFPSALRCLEAQDCGFRLELIENVAPMSRALQAMLDRCQTPFFVQVDEDMLLDPGAVRTLLHRIKASSDKAAIVTCHLFDEHLERVIYGLKVYRHDIVRRYPYRDVEGCEFDQIQRFQADGYLDARVPLDDPQRRTEACLGRHGTAYTDRAAFERYRTLEQKRRRETSSRPTTSALWVREYVHYFLDRFLDQGSRVDYYALMGVLSGAFSPLRTSDHEKNYHDYDSLPGFAEAQAFMEQAGRGLAPRERDGAGAGRLPEPPPGPPPGSPPGPGDTAAEGQS